MAALRIGRVTAIILLALTVQCQATTYFVATTGNDSNPGTAGQPFLTLTGAYSHVVAGDTINVQPGTYTDYAGGFGVYFNKAGISGSPITVHSVVLHGAIIDGTGTTYAQRHACVWIGQPYNILDGFTLQNCAGSGVFVQPDSTSITGVQVRNNEIRNMSNPVNDANPGHGGQGIYQDAPIPAAANNIFCNNYIHDIGASWDSGFDHGMYVGGNSDLYCNNIINNITFGNGIQLANSRGSISGIGIYHNTISNTTHRGIVVWSETGASNITVSIANNILYGNGTYGVAGCSAVGTVTASNNLGFNNTSGDYLADSCGGGTATWTTAATGPAPIHGNPIFVNPASDFHLQAGSPAIGAGIPLTGVVATDFSGNARPSSSGWDIGAYNFGLGCGS